MEKELLWPHITPAFLLLLSFNSCSSKLCLRCCSNSKQEYRRQNTPYYYVINDDTWRGLTIVLKQPMPLGEVLPTGLFSSIYFLTHFILRRV